MDAAGFGWREIIMLAAALAAIYLIVALVALARLRWRPGAERVVAGGAHIQEPVDAVAANNRARQHPFQTPVDLSEALPPDLSSIALVTETASQAGGTVNTEQAPAAPFAATLAMTGLEAEVQRLREEVASLRKELAEFQEARRVSPLYADAAALAHRGFDARGVAEECGISVAEAELVLAMSRDDKNFDTEVDDERDRISTSH